MGNHQGRRASRTSLAPHLDERDLDFLVTETKLSSAEVLQYYDRFCGATRGSDVINRQTFSEIMRKCYPRTYKVNIPPPRALKTTTRLIYPLGGVGGGHIQPV